jgi:hypothetical protein
MKRILIALFALLIAVSATDAQPSPEVYVTTQDYLTLRAGPGTHWERLAVLPIGATYRAVGRDLYGTWIQIAYDGALDAGALTDNTIDGITYGWLNYRLLVWSGNILELPVDGIATTRTARSVGDTIILMPDTYIYEGVVDPSTRVANPMITPVTVEVTGRLGSTASGYFWIQFKLNGRFYWTATWAVDLPYTPRVPDAAYLYPYSRVNTELRTNQRRLAATLNDIGGRWRALAYGTGNTTCNNIPDDAELTGLTDADLQREPLFAPPTLALRDAQTQINEALALFRAVCATPTQGVAPETVQQALTAVDAAERALNIVAELIAPFQRADPILGGE